MPKSINQGEKMALNSGKNQEQGFTLVEVLIALAILAIGLLMAANLQTTAISGNKGSSEMSVGTLLAQQAVEQLLTYSISASNNSLTDPSLYAGNHTATTEQARHATLIPDTPVNGVLYTRQYSVATDTPILGARTIIMTVNWTDTSTHQIVLVERLVPTAP